MSAFALPLYAIVGLEAIVAAILMLPSPLSEPAIQLVKLTRTQVGRTVVYTLTAVLVILLIAPGFSAYRLHKSDSPAAAGAGNKLEVDHEQTTAQLDASLNLAALSLLFLVRKLGLVLDERNVLRKELEVRKVQ